MVMAVAGICRRLELRGLSARRILDLLRRSRRCARRSISGSWFDPTPAIPTRSAVFAALLRRTIADDRYPLSPRIRVLQAILDRIEPPLVREPLPPLRHYAPPRAKASRRRG
jgi:hypothetical protein